MIRFRPGQQTKTFAIERKNTTKDDKGRVTYGDFQTVGSLKGSIAMASQDEKNRWNQQSHPISHAVLVYRTSDTIAGDVLECGGRKFYVKGKENPGELGIYEVLYCEERL